MTTFPPSFLDELRNRLTLSDIVGRRAKLERAGREFKACCPFHQEKSASFTINDQKGFYHCFGCGAHGDVIGFTMRIDNLPFPEAVERLAEEAGMPMPQTTPAMRAVEEKRHHLLGVIERACAFFEKQFWANNDTSGNAALRYAQSRNLSPETMRNFRLGYAPADGQALIAHLRQQKVPDELMIEAGIARRSERDNSVYSFFRDRLLFPITDNRGRVIAFGGRVLNDNKDVAKYINSSDHSLFNKGHLLYNLARAQHATRKESDLIIVEGYMDVIGCSAAGFAGAVAPNGTALTEHQIQLAWKQIPPNSGRMPIVCFDGDNAGRRAASRALERALPILQPGRSLKFAFLPQGQDPDSLIRSSGRGAFEKIIESAVNLVDLLWQDQLAQHPDQTPEGKANLKRSLLSAVDTIKDNDVKAYYRAEMLQRLDNLMPKRNGGTFVKGAFGQKGRFTPAIPVKLSIHNNREVARARHFLTLLLSHPDYIHEFHDMLAEITISDSALNQIRDAMLSDGDLSRFADALPVPPAPDPALIHAQLHDMLGHWHQEQSRLELRLAADNNQENLSDFAAELITAEQTKQDGFN